MPLTRPSVPSTYGPPRHLERGFRRYTALGVTLILLGLAQVNVGVRAADKAQSWLLSGLSTDAALWIATLLWFVAMIGFIAAGFGLLGVVGLRARWQRLMLTALAASVLLLVLFAPLYTVNVAILDVVALAAVFRWGPREGVVHYRAGRIAHVLAVGMLGYLSVITLLRPWYIRWGTRGSEWQAPLVGDDVMREPAFQVTRAIDIHAPAEQVWPWLAQMGQDRAGFYSYDWLERVVGFDVHNADRVVPEWQHRNVGELVPAAPPNFLGGVFGPNFGWRVHRFEPNQCFAIGSPIFGWIFVLQPIDDRNTRLIVRLRGDASPRPGLFFITIGDFVGGQAMHFIMEHKMLVTLKRRAEGTPRSAGPS